MCGTDSSYTATVDVNCVVGLDEVALNSTIGTVYNPSSGNLEVTIKNSALNGNYSLHVVNALGQVVYSEKTHISNGQAFVKISLAEAADGIYFLQFSGNEVNFSKKFFKE